MPIQFDNITISGRDYRVGQLGSFRGGNGAGRLIWNDSRSFHRAPIMYNIK